MEATMAAKLIKVRITSAVVIAGAIVGASPKIHALDELLARDLVSRNKAELAAVSKEDVAVDDLAGIALEDMNVAQLRTVAEYHKVEGFKKMKQADLVAAIELAEEAGDDD
jgi:hypothetical protein